jgi:hypothetical protein
MRETLIAFKVIKVVSAHSTSKYQIRGEKEDSPGNDSFIYVAVG